MLENTENTSVSLLRTFLNDKLSSEMIVSRIDAENANGDCRGGLLHLAAVYERIEIVQALLEKGANPLSRNDGYHFKKTPLQALIMNVMIKKSNFGIKPSEKIQKIISILENAELKRKKEIPISYERNQQNKIVDLDRGETQLHHAIRSGNFDQVQELLKDEESPFSLNQDGLTPKELLIGQEKKFRELGLRHIPKISQKIEEVLLLLSEAERKEKTPFELDATEAKRVCSFENRESLYAIR